MCSLLFPLYLYILFSANLDIVLLLFLLFLYYYCWRCYCLLYSYYYNDFCFACEVTDHQFSLSGSLYILLDWGPWREQGNGLRSYQAKQSGLHSCITPFWLYSSNYICKIHFQWFLMDSQVERIIADRIKQDSSGDVVPEYLVKWQGLSYAEATWYVNFDWSLVIVSLLLLKEMFLLHASYRLITSINGLDANFYIIVIHWLLTLRHY